MKNKAVFFSTDALIALIVILLSIIVIYPIVTSNNYKQYTQGDVIKVLSNLKIGEIDNGYVKSLIASREIKNLNQSVLEQIGEFYVSDME